MTNSLQIFNKVDIPPPNTGVNMPVTIYESSTTVTLSSTGYYRFEDNSSVEFSSVADTGTTIFISAKSNLTITSINLFDTVNTVVTQLDGCSSIIVREKDDLWRLILKY